MRNKKRYMIAVSLLACLLGVNMVVNNASATVNGDELLKKVLLRGLPTCYSNEYTKLRIENIYDSPVLSDLFTEKGKSVTNDTILVPSKNLGNSLTQSVPGVSCLQVFEGYNGIGDNKISGLYGLYGKTANPLEISKIGYSEKKVVEATKRCIYLEYSNSRGASGETGKSNGICFNVDSNGNIMDDPDTVGLLDYEFEEVDKEYPIIADLSQGTWATPLFSYRFTDTKNEYVDTEGNGGAREINGCQDKMVFDELVKCLNEKQLPSNLQNPNGGTPLALTTSFDSSNGNTSAGSEWWKKTNGYKDAIDYFTGGSGGELPNFSEQERFDLLSYYVQKVIDENDNISIDMDSCDADKAKLGEDYGVINNGLWCKISGWDTVGENFNVIRQTNDTRHQALETVDFEEVLKQLKEVDESKLTDKSGTGVTDDPSGGNVEGGETETTCMNAGGAQKLGWIVCTVMELLGKAAQDAYEDIVEPSLRVEPQLFSGGNGGVRGAWETFRNFANIAFIILFLVVIFSQLTGVGIDNYGIKKILPKLIVVAILINLSYVLCIVMVDLSNILGNALRGLFDGLGAGLNPSLSIPNSDVNMDSETLTSTVITGVAILGALVAMGGMIWKNPAIVLSLLVAALGVAVSIFFLFVLLAIREAAIVVLVAIAPLAVVCYALPNTKKLFDKWWKFFEGLLLVYPICGLLVGGGNYVSKLLLTSGFAGGSFLQGLTAMIVGIVPIFFIPTVLKGSFAAMGKVGGMLTGMGDRARKGATGRVRGSEAYKNAQKMGLGRKMRYKAGYSERKGGLTATGRLKSKVAQSRFGRITGMNKRQAAYVETAKKNADIGKESTAILMSEAAAADLAHSGMAPKDYFQDKIDKVGTDIRKLDSVISAAQKRGVKNKDIMAMIRKASNSGNLRFANDASRLNWMNSMLQNHNDITSTDFEGQEWMRAGGGGALGNYGDYAAGHLNASDIDISDLSKIAGNSMAGLIKAGMISKSVAQQWLVANPNASPDKKIMMGAVACGAVTAANLAGMNAEIFKNEAEALANGTTPGTNVIETGVNAVNADLASRGRNIITLEDRVASWTAQQQARTYISQDASSMAPGQLQREDNPVFVHEVGAPSSGGGGFGGRYPGERARMENEAARQAGLDVPHDDSAS